MAHRLGRAARRVAGISLRAAAILCAALLVAAVYLRQPWPYLVHAQSFLSKVSQEELRLEQLVDERVRAWSQAPQRPDTTPTGLWQLRAIRAQEARAVIEERWGRDGSRPRIRVGIFDGVMAPNHPDLAEDLLPGPPVDSTAAGLSWVFFVGHGVGVMGIIAGKGNPGMTGVAPHAALAPFSSLPASDRDPSWTAALRHFQSAGARVANFSIAAPQALAEQATIDEAYSAGVLLVTGLYNDNSDRLAYPAAYSKVLVDSGIGLDERSVGFGWGPLVEVVAPALGMRTTAPVLRVGPVAFGHPYQHLCCNSVAASLVTGVAALALEHDPTLASPQVEKRIKLSARKTPAMVNHSGEAVLWHPRYGYGVVEAYAAVTHDRRGPGVTITTVEQQSSGKTVVEGHAIDDVDDSGMEPIRERDKHLFGVPTSNVHRVEYRLDEGAWHDAQLSPLKSSMIAPEGFVRRFAILLNADRASGEYRLSVRAWDSAGNAGPEAMRGLRVEGRD